MRKYTRIMAAVCSILMVSTVTAQKKKGKTTVNPTDIIKSEAIADLQAKYPDYKGIALQIWDFAEVGYKEVKSSTLHQKTLTDAGFTVTAGVADMPTAFVATYGSGSCWVENIR